MDLLIEVGEAVLDLEDVHQLGRKRAGDGAGELVRITFVPTMGCPGKAAIHNIDATGGVLTTGGDGRSAATRGRVPRRKGSWLRRLKRGSGAWQQQQ